MPTYSKYGALRATRVPVVSCSILNASYMHVRDADTWESFDEPALVQYLADGVHAFSLRIDELSQPSHILDEYTTKELFFMLESLLHAKNLLMEKNAAVDHQEYIPAL